MMGSFWRRRDRGATALEFALVAPVLLFIMLAVADFGNGLQQSIRLEEVARAGAQSAIGGTYNAAKVRSVVSANLGDWRLTTDSPAGNVTLTTALACRCQAAPGTNGTSFDCINDDPAVVCSSFGGDFAQFVSVTVTRPYTALFIFPLATLRGNVELRLR